MVNNINTHINMHKIMNTHINTHINNINTHNLYLRWRAARRRRARPRGLARREGGQAPEWGGAVCSGRTAAARGRRGEGAAASRQRGGGQTARRRVDGAAVGRWRGGGQRKVRRRAEKKKKRA
jgi:hypothetical protein